MHHYPYPPAIPIIAPGSLLPLQGLQEKNLLLIAVCKHKF